MLKSGLVLAGVSDVAFKVKNFTAANMALLDEQWDSITDHSNSPRVSSPTSVCPLQP